MKSFFLKKEEGHKQFSIFYELKKAKKEKKIQRLKEKFAKKSVVKCIFKKLLINSIGNLKGSLRFIKEISFYAKKELILEKKTISFDNLRKKLQRRLALLKRCFLGGDRFDHKHYILRKYENSPKFCIITQSTTNIFVTVLEMNGEPFLSLSGGNFKIKKNRQIKSTSTAIKFGESVLFALRKRKTFELYLIISYPINSFLLRAFVQVLKKDFRIKIKYIINLQKFAHNGCRFRKKPRN